MMVKDTHGAALACMLVELDCLFDTRLGTIAKIARDQYAQVLVSGYFSRSSDHFEGIDSKLFEESYAARDAVTLSLSMMTHVPGIIKDFATRVNITSASSPVKVKPSLHVNTYPYHIPERVEKMLTNALLSHIQEPIEISFVRYSPQDLFYDLVKFTYDHLVMYNTGAWLDAQAQEWADRERGLPDVTVMCPMISLAKNKNDVPKDVSEDANAVAQALSPVINLFPMPVQFFCSVMDPNIVTPEAEAPGVKDAS